MTKLRHYAWGSIGTMIIAAILAGIVIFMGNRPLEPFVSYKISEIGLTSDLCPGDIVPTKVDAVIRSPSVVNVSVTFAQANGLNLVGTQQELGVRVFDKPTSFVQDISWVVPELPPGDYIRVTAITSQFADVKPWFLRIPFSIREGCR